MENGSKFYMVKKKALPEILLKVAEANVLLNRGKAKTIKEAIDAVDDFTNHRRCGSTF